MERGGSELSEAEERLSPLLLPDIEEHRIQLEEFEGLYDPRMIERDKKEVLRLEDLFEKDAKANPEAEVWSKRGKLFEAMVNNQIEESNWLGESAEVIIPSKYDDYINKIDSILEFDAEGTLSHLALAIDVTKSLDEIQKKLSQIKKSIDSGELSTIKYFRSQTERGEKTAIPRVVVGADQKTMNELAELLLRFRLSRGKNSEEFKKTRAILEKHPVQLQILLEIRHQLSAFKKYAEETNPSGPLPAFDRILDAINPIFTDIRSEEDYLERIGRLKEDAVFNLIIEEAKAFPSS